MSVVVDTSVVVKWFFPEVYQVAADRVLAMKERMIAPDLLWPEFGSVLMKKLSRQETTLGHMSVIGGKFMDYPIDRHPTQPFFSAAVALAWFTGASVYDAFFLALAEQQKCPLISADRRLCEAAKKAHIQHIWIGDLS